MRGEFKVYVGGTFDLFHFGHARFFRNIKRYFRKKNKSSLFLLSCDLVVAVNSDQFAISYKRKPVMNEEERLEVVKSCKYVDDAFIMPSESQQESCIKECNPNYIVLGSDWKKKDYLGQLSITQNMLDNMGCTIIFMPYTKNISTSKIVERILNINVL